MRKDPVGTNYYVPLKRAEMVSTLAFYGTAVFSVLALLIPPKLGFWYNSVQVLFPFSALVLFLTSASIKSYWAPRAHEKRVADLLTSVFRVALIDTPSTGFYNNNQTDPSRRLNAIVLENCFFGRQVVRGMLPFERLSAACYSLIWLVALLNRSTELGIITVAAQVIFSEQILSRWLKIEFLRGRLDRAYDTAHELATATLRRDQFNARALQNYTFYEVWKAEAGISQSSRIFHKLNSRLSAEWQIFARQLGLL